jgi:hypothetical protein
VFRAAPDDPLAYSTLARFKIHKQVLEAAGDAIDSVVLGGFMHWWVRK